MAYSVSFDWSEEFKERFEEWENLGRQMAESSCNHHDEDNPEDTNMYYKGYCEECGFSEDSNEPMMNYAYPLDIEPSEEAIKNVIENTNLTIMYHCPNFNTSNTYYLVLTGGGMDLSQDIALAYYYCQRWIPEELLRNVCTQKGLSVGGEKWTLLRKEMIYQAGIMEERAKQLKETWEKTKE